VIDSFSSLIWTKRYYTCGDFEICIPADDELLEFIKADYFIRREDDDTVMIIERLQIQTDVENGDYFIISGRSLESILARRVITTQILINSMNPILGIKLLVDTCTFGSRRAIPGLVVDTSFPLDETVTTQFTGNTLINAISSICTRYGIGFKIILSEQTLTLSFYQGEEVNVTFSPEYDNLINSTYVFDYTNYANFAHVAGEGEGRDRRGRGVNTIIESGLAHREVYVDARDISSNNGEVSSVDYAKMLEERGLQKLEVEHSVTKSFEAEIEPNMTYEYGKDYNLGDIITVTNEYGIISKPRIVEIIESWDENGYTVVPTFEELEVE
jgi:hypothetical protein